MLPTFIIPGAAKSGTTALWKYVSDHPNVCMASKKEPAFFSDVKSMYQTGDISDHTVAGNYSKGLSWYKHLYQNCDNQKARGEASTLYFHAEDAPSKIKNHVPGVKLIFILRHPVDRLYSHYWQARRSAHEVPKAFSKFVRRKGPKYKEYSEVSHYEKNINRFKEYFGRDKMKILINRDLIDRAEKSMRHIYKFIGVDEKYRVGQTEKKFNQIEIPKYPFLVKIRRKVSSKTRIFKMIPDKIKNKIKSTLKEFNYEKFDYPPMGGKIRDELLEEFEKDVCYVEKETGKNLDAWRV